MMLEYILSLSIRMLREALVWEERHRKILNYNH